MELVTWEVHERVMDEPDSKKRSTQKLHRPSEVADLDVTIEAHNRQRPGRNRAIMVLPYYTRLRVSELLQLTRDPFALVRQQSALQPRP